VILVGSDYWNGLLQWIRDTLLARHLISPDDPDLVTVVDEPDEVVRLIKKFVIV
jgi:hypothetical protein